MVSEISISLADVAEVAERSELSLCGVLDIESAERALQLPGQKLAEWQAKGYAAEMQYMQRPSELFTNLKAFLPGVKSVIGFTIPYLQTVDESCLDCPSGYGRVARYAWGKDYHRVIKRRLKGFCKELQEKLPPDIVLQARSFTDAVPILERALAQSIQPGFIGKNTLYIRPGIGSFTFLAELLVSIRVEEGQRETQHNQAPPGSGCKSCERCLSQCPTGALLGPGILDARLCISYLTIEKRTLLSPWESEAIGNWLFGCDICQSVCPFNHRGLKATALSEFSKSSGVGSVISLEEVLQIHSAEAYLSRFAGTPLMRAGRDNLLRNACCVAVNTNYEPAFPLIARAAKSDLSALVRAQAARCLEQIKAS